MLNPLTMNDPHVATLTYRVLESQSLEFSNPPDVLVDTADFKGRLSASSLTLEPKQHYESEADIRPIADAFVRAWEINAGLDYGWPHFRFRFEGSQVIDRQPSPKALAVHLSTHLYVSVDVHAKLTGLNYPDPPQKFCLTPEVETMWDRFCRYADGQEPLLSMAYFCLTLLERGNRSEAAQHYAIHIDVLRKLGELTSTSGLESKFCNELLVELGGL